MILHRCQYHIEKAGKPKRECVHEHEKELRGGREFLEVNQQLQLAGCERQAIKHTQIDLYTVRIAAVVSYMLMIAIVISAENKNAIHSATNDIIRAHNQRIYPIFSITHRAVPYFHSGVI